MTGMDEVEELRARVLAVHTRRHYDDLPFDICEQCSEDRGYQWWPCPTVAALDTP